jgi:acetoin utilization protein AcuB
MIVGMWMTRNLVCIQADTPVEEAARLMRDNRIRRLPVVARNSDDLSLLGIVSATDVYRAYPLHCNPFAAEPPAQPVVATAAQIMSTSVATTSPDTPLEDAATVMQERKIGALPVVRQGRLLGLITESDIFRAFISILKADADAVRVTFSVASDEDLFSLLADAVRDSQIQVLSMMASRREGQSMCVARITGQGVEKFIDTLWKSGHQVMNVLHAV